MSLTLVPHSGQGISARFRRDLSIVPHNNFVGKPIHRVDLRLLKKVRLARRASIDGIFEVYKF